MMSNKAYDTIKRLIQVVLPALGAFYAGLALLWGLPNAEEVVATVALLCTFLNVVLGISSTKYFKSGDVFDGAVVMTEAEGGGLEAHAGLITPPEEIVGKTHIVLRVSKPEV